MTKTNIDDLIARADAAYLATPDLGWTDLPTLDVEALLDDVLPDETCAAIVDALCDRYYPADLLRQDTWYASPAGPVLVESGEVKPLTMSDLVDHMNMDQRMNLSDALERALSDLAITDADAVNDATFMHGMYFHGTAPDGSDAEPLPLGTDLLEQLLALLKTVHEEPADD